MRPIVRVGLSLAIVLVAYGGYAVTAVPLIEPAPEAAVEPAPASLSSAPIQEIDPADRMYRWFGPDRQAWELQKPKMLRNDQGILLFQKYESDPEKLGPRKVRLEPVKLVYLSDGEGLDPQVRDRQAIIMRAPMGAVLEFDRPFNVLRGDVGRLVGGMLTGEVVIHSEGKSPGPEDDLRIVTHDVKLTATTITTNDHVKFEYGPNRGSGTEMDIHLLPEEERRESSWGRIQTFTLKRDILLDLVVDEKAAQSSSGLGPLGRQGAPAAGPLEFSPERPIVVHNGEPVKVRCRGPLEFNAADNLATFESAVVVTRQPLAAPPGCPPDKLTCHRLELHLVNPAENKTTSEKENPGDKRLTEKKNLAAKEKPSGGAARAGKSDRDPSKQPPKVEVRRVVAIGREEERGVRSRVPAVLDAPASGAHAIGQRLEYDLETRRVSLIDEKEAIFRQQASGQTANEIHARELHYQPGLDGRLGRFEAEGSGWLNWEARDVRAAQPGATLAAPDTRAGGEARRFLVRWSRKLFSIPSEGRQVISLLGDAKAQVTGMGRLDADEIHTWLFEQPQPLAPGASTQQPKYDLLPDRMMALSGGKDAKVVIDSPQLTGRTEKLEVFVQQPADAAKKAPPAHPLQSPDDRVTDGARSSTAERERGADRASAGPAAAVPPPDSAAQPSQRFDVAGQRMQLQLVQVGREAQWRQIDIFGGARLHETQTAKPGERPLEVTGDFVHATQTEPDAGQVTVTGKPAHVEGRGLSLAGGAVNLDQQTNKVWIDGPGLMTLIAERDLQGEKLSRPSPVEITWRGNMHFDGQRAVFDREALVKQQESTLRTQTLEAILSRRIDLAHPKQDESQQPQIDRVICRGGLLLDRTTRHPRGPTARERLQAEDLNLDQVSGAIFANGPGWLTRVSRRDAEPDGPGGHVGESLRDSRPRLGETRPRAGETSPRPGPAPAASPFAAPPDPDKPLDYLRVDFQGPMQGNIHQRVVVFSDQVLAVHAPVRNWDDTVNPDRIDLLGPRGAVLKCDELHLTEMRGPRDVKWFEAMAKGNTNVEGETFTAQADRLNYSQDKDLLVLQGTDRTPAELWRQEGPGTARSHLAARKVEFWRRDNHIKIDRATYGDVNDIPADKGRSRPKPSGR